MGSCVLAAGLLVAQKNQNPAGEGAGGTGPRRAGLIRVGNDALINDAHTVQYPDALGSISVVDSSS
jgi:hypothetical protein